MSLLELVDNSLFRVVWKFIIQKKFTAKNVLEVGIASGESIKLWHDFFPNAKIYGLDIKKISEISNVIKNKNRIILARYDDIVFTIDKTNI